MNPNDKFKATKKPTNNPCISVDNLPDRFQIKDPEEYRRDMLDMLDEMGICRKCHDHMPCGCEGD